MEEVVSAADANRSFSQILSGVRKGRRYVVTSHGEPIARIVPVQEPDEIMLRARKALLERLQRKRPVRIGKWTREELYEDRE